MRFARECLNSAASDIYYLYHALIDHYHKKDDRGLDGYSDKALARVWKAQRFSWWMTMLLHRFPGHIPYDQKLQDTELAYLLSSERAQQSLAENYVHNESLTHLLVREGHWWRHFDVTVPASQISHLSNHIVHLNVTKHNTAQHG